MRSLLCQVLSDPQGETHVRATSFKRKQTLEVEGKKSEKNQMVVVGHEGRGETVIATWQRLLRDESPAGSQGLVGRGGGEPCADTAAPLCADRIRSLTISVSTLLMGTLATHGD